VAAALLMMSAALAWSADPGSLYGKWLERFSNGSGMVTEFTATTLSYYPVDAAGKPTEAARENDVTYLDLDAGTVRVNLQGGGALSVLIKDPKNIVLDDGGAVSHRLVRMSP
jgi:hypothetical protein